MAEVTSRRGRGWDRSERAMPAAQYEIQIDRGLLPRASADWPSYVVVSTPSSYRMARPFLAHEALGIAYAESSDATHLRVLSDSLPDGAELVIGLGGGRALDASKYVALDKGLPLILVPTIVSTGAIIHSSVAIWDGHRLVVSRTVYPWVDPERVLVDCDLVLKAPYYLNTAGLADVLCGYSGIAEWRRNLKLGRAKPEDAVIISAQEAYYASLSASLADSLTDEKTLSEASVRLIMRAIQERDSRALRLPAAPNLDHTFWNLVELANEKSWVHGEMVALGALIIAWRCGNAEPYAAMLDQSLVRHCPTQIGLQRDELRHGLEYIANMQLEPRFRALSGSVLRQEPIVGADFDALWDYLEA